MRLPTQDELQEVYEHGISYDGWFWSASPNDAALNEANKVKGEYRVYLSTGTAEASAKRFQNNVLCVGN